MLDILEADIKVGFHSTEPIYSLVNFTKAYISNDYMTKVKEINKDRPEVVKKIALIGIDSTVKKLLLKGYLMVTRDKIVKVFDNAIEAKDWLIEGR